MLYELSINWSDINFLAIIFGIMIVFFFAFTYFGSKSFEQVYDIKLPEFLPTKEDVKERAVLGLTIGCIIFAIAFYVLIKDNIYVFYNYYAGNYEIVEGYVEEFKPLFSGGHGVESFSINDVEFSYAEGII